MSDWPGIWPPYVTVLPASPVNDQRCVLEVDAATGLAWTLRYNSALSKWVFLGGPELLGETTTAETTTSGTYADLSGGATGPSITLPTGGLYDVTIGAVGYSGTAAGIVRMSYAIGATAADTADQLIGLSNSTGAAVQGVRTRRKTIAGSAAIVLLAKYLRDTGGQTGNFNQRYITARPIHLNP